MKAVAHHQQIQPRSRKHREYVFLRPLLSRAGHKLLPGNLTAPTLPAQKCFASTLQATTLHLIWRWQQHKCGLLSEAILSYYILHIPINTCPKVTNTKLKSIKTWSVATQSRRQQIIIQNQSLHHLVLEHRRSCW